MNNSIDGSMQTLEQLICFIDDLNDTEYQYSAKPWFNSSIGQHLRHIVDLYLALMNHNGLVDYDARRRGAAIESSRLVGLEELATIKQWLLSLDETNLNTDIRISTEVSLESQQALQFRSTFARELCFAASHLTHHLAIMAVIAKMSGHKVDASLGLAPATATYVRNEMQQVEDTQPCVH